MACTVAGVSTTTFYGWLAAARRGPSPRELDEAYLVNQIHDAHRASHGAYGAPRITPVLRRTGQRINHKRVERLMRVHGIAGVFKPATVRTTIPAEENPPIPDLIGRNFAPGCANVAWAGDITYIRTGEGWLYLASVLDLGSRRLLGYSMACHMRTELVTNALDMAVGARGGEVDQVIFHGDRGSQYLSGEYRDRLGALQMRQSVGRTGICWDNAVAEAFWSSLKRELIHRYRFATRADARRAIFRWLNWYNQHRLHSTLHYLSPVEWEQQYRQQHLNSGKQAA
jgi:transposase InsO family protein